MPAARSALERMMSMANPMMNAASQNILREASCAAALNIAKELAKGNNKPKDVAEAHQAAAREALQKVIAASKNEKVKSEAQSELNKMKK